MFKFLCIIFYLIIFESSLTFSSNFVTQANLFISPLARGPEKVGRSDSGIDYPKYEAIVNKLFHLGELFPNFSEIVNVGKTVNGVETYGILIRNKLVNAKTFISITGATHGNEYLNIADRIPEELLNQDNQAFYEFYDRGGVILVIPIFNPDGYIKRVRTNANDVDLNRDFSSLLSGVELFTQNETKNYKNLIEEILESTGASFEMVLDYHCCYSGTLLFPWGYADVPLEHQEREVFDDFALLLKNHMPELTFGETNDLLWYSADGTSLDYWYSKYHTISLTYEGRFRTERDYLNQHVLWLKDIVARY